MMKIADKLKELFVKKSFSEKANKMPSLDYKILAFLIALCLLCWALKPFFWFRIG